MQNSWQKTKILPIVFSGKILVVSKFIQESFFVSHERNLSRTQDQQEFRLFCQDFKNMERMRRRSSTSDVPKFFALLGGCKSEIFL